MARTTKPDYRSKVFLSLYNKDGRIVEETKLSYEEYYESGVVCIDDDKYRRKRRIRRITGRIFNLKNELQSEFENEYDKRGQYISGRVRHQDGTVTSS